MTYLKRRVIEGWSGKRFSMRTIRFLLAFLILAIPAASFGQIGVSIAIGPPELPVYEQPILPADGYLWTPGYWAYDNTVSDYYWVPGAWVEPPQAGYLWTPGYWGWGGGGYLFNEGYWGMNIGFYGGINYGFGYFGEGFGGGRWDGGHFFYNRSVSNINVTNIHNVYDTHIDVTNVTHVSFNGGTGGVVAKANAQQEAAAHENHLPAVAAQTERAQTARANPESRASVNHGKPAIAEAPKAAEVAEHPAEAKEPAAAAKPEAAAAKPEAESKPAEAGLAAHPAVHPNDLAPIARPAAVDSGNAKADKKYEQQQDKLIANQTKERQSLQQKQDAEHQQLTKQKASDAQTQKVEQKHQQQTKQQTQKHASQQQQMQSHQPQPRAGGGGSHPKG
jgi:hypothetical protein